MSLSKALRSSDPTKPNPYIGPLVWLGWLVGLPDYPKMPVPGEPGCRPGPGDKITDMPHLPRPKKSNRQPGRRAPSGRQSLYRSATWQRQTNRYRIDNPLCEACQAAGVLTDITPGGRKGVTDHVVQVTAGGAEMDERNLMGLCKECHDRKSRLEQAGAFAEIETTANHLGETIPTQRGREQAVRLLNEGRGG